MNKRRAISFLVVFAVFVVYAQKNWTLEGVSDGKLVGSDDLKNRNVIIVVWSSWAPRCNTIKQDIIKLSSKWGKDVDIWVVNFQEDEDQVLQFLGKDLKNAKLFIDKTGKFSRFHNITELPAVIVYKDGTAVFKGTFVRDPEFFTKFFK